MTVFSQVMNPFCHWIIGATRGFFFTVPKHDQYIERKPEESQRGQEEILSASKCVKLPTLRRCDQCQPQPLHHFLVPEGVKKDTVKRESTSTFVVFRQPKTGGACQLSKCSLDVENIHSKAFGISRKGRPSG
jgi:hypothetical protein